MKRRRVFDVTVHAVHEGIEKTYHVEAYSVLQAKTWTAILFLSEHRLNARTTPVAITVAEDLTPQKKPEPVAEQLRLFG